MWPHKFHGCTQHVGVLRLPDPSANPLVAAPARANTVSLSESATASAVQLEFSLVHVFTAITACVQVQKIIIQL